MEMIRSIRKVKSKRTKILKRKPMVTAATMLALVATHSPKAYGQEPEDQAEPVENVEQEKVDVDQIKEKYWAQGKKKELGVVQNRIYKKEKRLEVGAFGGIILSDPFLSVFNAGTSVGYHFSEYFGLQLIGWKHFVQPSNALRTFEATRQATTNTNEPRAFFALEGKASLIYGKLSLVGKKILHYDMHFIFGPGLTLTETGNYFTPVAGIGQQTFISESVSIRLDYRFLPYKENIKEKVIPTKIGQKVADRWNLNHSIVLGVSFFFGGAK
jgi:outer membrane beta-barrel protein